MFQRRALERIEERQQETMEALQTVMAGLIASDPRTSMAADAYNGLRKQVVAAAQERRRMLLQLVAVNDAIERGADVAALRDMCGQWIAEAGLRRAADPEAEPELFDLGAGEVSPLELVSPAWVDTASGAVMQRGMAKGVVPEPEPEPEPAIEAAVEPAVEPEAAEPEAAEAEPESEAAPAEADDEAPEPETGPGEENDDAETTAKERR